MICKRIFFWNKNNKKKSNFKVLLLKAIKNLDNNIKRKILSSINKSLNKNYNLK